MYDVYVIDLRKLVGFEWDAGNVDKNYKKHGITVKEAETVFLDKDLQVEPDFRHQEREKRYIAIGHAQEQKVLFVIFTIRNTKVRIISARIASKKETGLYEKNVAKNSKV